MKEVELPKRMRSIEDSKDWKEFYKYLCHFLEINNFHPRELQIIIHALNSFYMLGADIENYNLNVQKKESLQA